jgi:hypothetical protein
MSAVLCSQYTGRFTSTGNTYQTHLHRDWILRHDDSGLPRIERACCEEVNARWRGDSGSIVPVCDASRACRERSASYVIRQYQSQIRSTGSLRKSDVSQYMRRRLSTLDRPWPERKHLRLCTVTCRKTSYPAFDPCTKCRSKRLKIHRVTPCQYPQS